MVKGKAFLVIGHSNWGKSRTLGALVRDIRVRYLNVSGTRIFIRRMSNDDRPEGFVSFVRSLYPTAKPHVFIAFCPDFKDGDATDILKDLSMRYEIYSFVLRYSYDGTRNITDEEVKTLRRFGVTKIFDEIAEAEERAAAFIDFVKNVIS